MLCDTYKPKSLDQVILDDRIKSLFVGKFFNRENTTKHYFSW